jgi:hypothetical protein
LACRYSNGNINQLFWLDEGSEEKGEPVKDDSKEDEDQEEKEEGEGEGEGIILFHIFLSL